MTARSENDKAYRELAEMVVGLQRRIDGLSTSQLAHSSLENTGLPVYSETGQLSGMMGRLPDGSYGTTTLSGPVPPIPSAPKVLAVRGVGLEIEWDGLFADAQAVVPLEGGRLEVYVDESPDITPIIVPVYTMESPRGGKFLLSVGYDQIHFVAFAWRAASGKVSACSAVAGPCTVGRATKEDLEVNFDELRGTMIFYGPDEPVTEKADLWLRENPDGTQTALRFDPGQANEVGQWVELQDQGVVAALQAAAEANELAGQAGVDALAALGVAGTAQDAAQGASGAASEAQTKANQAAQAAADAAAAAQAARGVADTAAGAAATAQGAATAANTKALEAAGIAAGKGTIYYQTSAPATGDLNGLWIDTDDGFKPYRYVAGAWSYVENTSVQAAASAAAAADTKAVNAATAASNAAAAALAADGKAVQAAADALAASNLAASKNKTFNQITAPASGFVAGDQWLDTDDGNKRYVAAGSPVAWVPSLVGYTGISATARQLGSVTTYRQSAAPASGMVTGDFWIDSDDNVLYRYEGTWVKSQDTGIASALGSIGTLNTTVAAKTTVFYQTTAPATTGRTVGDLWVDTDGGNLIYTWVTATGWTAFRLQAPALDVTARQLGGLTTYRQSAAPASGMVTGDFWIDSDDNVIYRYEGTWVKSQDVNINTAIQNAATAKAIADGKMRIFPQPTAPAGLTADDIGDLWIDTDDSNVSYTWDLVTGTTYGWIKRQLGNGAIAPQSLIASNVIATGTVSAALFEALLVLTTEVIAGNPLGNHARMTPQGFRVYQEDPVDGVPNEVVRMGTETSDYFGIVNAAGELVASVDNTGSGNFNKVTAKQLVVGGRDLAVALGNGPRGEVAYFLNSPGFDLAPIFNPVGVAEFGFQVEKGRSYHFKFRMFVFANAGVQVQANGRWTQGNDGDVTTAAPAPTISSASFAEWRMFPAGDNKSQTFDGEATWVAQRTTRVRLGLTIQTGSDGAIGFVALRNAQVEMSAQDVGRHVGQTGQFSNMGGQLNGQVTPPPPASVSQQYYVDLAPAGWTSIRGNGTTRTDVPGPVQGWDPSGYNGDGKGHWWFNMPNITGTVDRAFFYAYSNHWGPNSGGTAIFNVATGSAPYTKPRGDWQSPGWPKPGGKEVELPADWLPLFRSAGAYGFPQANGITVGPSGGTNNVFYGRFDGPSARLRIYYTQ